MDMGHMKLDYSTGLCIYLYICVIVTLQKDESIIEYALYPSGTKVSLLIFDHK